MSGAGSGQDGPPSTSVPLLCSQRSFRVTAESREGKKHGKMGTRSGVGQCSGQHRRHFWYVSRKQVQKRAFWEDREAAVMDWTQAPTAEGLRGTGMDSAEHSGGSPSPLYPVGRLRLPWKWQHRSVLPRGWPACRATRADDRSRATDVGMGAAQWPLENICLVVAQATPTNLPVSPK